MVIIDAYRGGDDIGYTGNGIIEKDFNLMISKYISDRLNELGIETYLTRDTDTNLNINQRIDLIKDINDPKAIAISNRVNNSNENGVEIIYSLRNSSASANNLEKAFNERGIDVKKVYQKRDENDTNLDFDDLLKGVNNVETIIIEYGDINNAENARNLMNNYKEYAESVVNFLTTRFGVSYSYNFPNIYVVKKGDSLYSIAKNYNISVDELKKYNNLTSNIISINQILKIPSSDTNNNNVIYMVEKGDSLWSISRKYNTTVEDIKKNNNLTSNVLSIGQKLIIPSSNTYIVQKGDSLWSISRKYNTTVDKIKSINNLSSNILNIGQNLVIP